MGNHINQHKESTNTPASAVHQESTVTEKPLFQFQDNRPKALAQRKIQSLANNSNRVRQMKSLKDTINSQPQKQSTQLKSPNVVQRVPDWMKSLVKLAKDNPIVSITAGIGAAGVLAYYYWNQQVEVPQQVQPQVQAPPDWTTLQGVADAVGVDVNTLQTQLETGVGNLDVNDLYQNGFDPNQETATGIVPPSIIANLPNQAQAKVDTVFARLNALNFTYTGNYESGTSSFLSHTGDCLSLAQMFLIAVEAAGVQGTTIQDDNTPMLVAQHAIHGRNEDRNLDGQAYWFFHDHHWADYQGTRYDLLFMANQTPNADHRTATDSTHNGVKYDLFAGGQALIHAGQFALLDVDVTGGRMGRAFHSENAAKAYIDQHKAG